MINEINSKIVFAIRCSDTPAVVIRQKEIEKCFFENGYAHIKELTLYQQNTNQSSQCRCQSGCTQTYIYSLIKRLKNNIFDSVVELRHQLQKSANNVGLILFSDIPYLSLLYLQHYSRKNNVMLLYDCYDWYSSETVTRHLFSSLESCYIQIMNTLFRQSIIRSDVKVIVVSTYLQNYFERRGKATLRIPITLETETIHPDAINKENHKLTIVYAGNPGKRDNLGIVIEAISKLNVNEQEMIQFIIAGIDTKHLAQLLTYDESTLSSLPYLEILGRVRRDEAISLISEADFTILIRPSAEKYAKAGFPTKVVESLMSSTPVICNITSDLGIYLNDGYNSIIVKTETGDDIISSLRRALMLSREEKIQMKRNARLTAEKYFDNKIYVEPFGKFIQEE